MDLRNGSVVAALLGALVLAAPAHAAPPPNDNFANAQAIAGTSASVPGTTVEATLETGEPNHFAGNGSVWYSWTPPQDMVVQLTTCYLFASSNPVKTQLWSGSTLSSLVELKRRADEGDCGTGSGGDVFRYNVTGGTTYAISVIEYGSDTTFTLGLEATPAPANDNFANAQDMGQAPDVEVDGTTVGATNEPGEPSSQGDTVWYRWTSPKRTRVWIDNCGGGDSAFTVYTGSALGSLTAVDENYEDSPRPEPCEDPVWHDRFEFVAKADTTYMIRVAARYPDNGPFHLRLRSIRYDAGITQSASATKIKAGKTVTYTIEAANLGTFDLSLTVVSITSKPDHLTKPVKGTKYVSVDSTRGTCKAQMLFNNPHPGAVCEIKLEPGETARIVAKVKPSESMSHWAYFGGFTDENPDNEDEEPLNVTVKPKRKHR
jgi:hypothetical protein